MNYLQIVLDRSGSMQATWDDTLGAINAHVEAVAKEDPSTTVAVTVFDSDYTHTPKIEEVRRCFASEYKPLTAMEVPTGGGTPLYDAIGKVVADMQKLPADIDRKALVIMTDGAENSSREWRRDTVSTLLNSVREAKWLVIFLGADEAVFQQGINIGAPVASSIMYCSSNVNETFQGVTRGTMDYFKAASADIGVMAASFTEEERNAAAGLFPNATADVKTA